MNQAKDMLRSYPSWNTHRENFRGNPEERNFLLVKNSQEEAAKVKSNGISKDILFSPVSNRTRQRTRERRREEHMTPTPSLETLTLNDDIPATGPVTPGTKKDGEFFSNSTGGSLGPEELLRDMYPTIDDEQIVNVALLNFLQALTDYFPSLGSSWTIHRKQLKAKFNGIEYEARTDGYLRGKVDGEEGAQIVAWLKNYSGSPEKFPFRIEHEIWLSFAEYDAEYIRYIEAGFQDPECPRSFLTMHEYGPFDTTKEPHMTELAVILLALTLRADHNRKVEQQISPFDGQQN
ncbi:hypothetical protein AbraIFM66951_007214 [Aspergillus brasiliensis]|nr:hypothetical protein AbraIFM66951_007214 [Aspergillus brasiliensis]